MTTADVLVIGLGGMGSATVLELARRGKRVLGIDQFTPPHTFGSSHGLSRMYRQAYWEDPRYVPMLLRAFDLWQDLSRLAGDELFHVTGGLVVGSRGGDLVARSLESAQRFRLPHRLLETEELRQQYPVLALETNTVALLEENAGYVVPELAITIQLKEALRAGADLRTEERVLSWEHADDAVTVRTTRESYSARRVIVTAGPWAGQLMAGLKLPVRVTRQVLYWFQPRARADAFREGKLPVYLFEAKPDEPLLYGFPWCGSPGRGVKVALHGSQEVCTPDSVRRGVDADDEKLIRSRLQDTLPDLAGTLLHAETCLYTMTPDEHFIVDFHPDGPAVIFAAGFSGHGFKFTPVIGEILADLAVEGWTKWNIEPFAVSRFQKRASITHP